MDINEDIIRLEIEDQFKGNIKIIDTYGNEKYILNKNNPYIDINQSFTNYKIISDEDTYIKIFHNI